MMAILTIRDGDGVRWMLAAELSEVMTREDDPDYQRPTLAMPAMTDPTLVDFKVVTDR